MKENKFLFVLKMLKIIDDNRRKQNGKTGGKYSKNRN